MDYEKYQRYEKRLRDVDALRSYNDRIMNEHLKQRILQAKKQGELGIMYGMSAEQLRSLMAKDVATLHGEDCVFLWACGIRADQDLVPQGGTSGR